MNQCSHHQKYQQLHCWTQSLFFKHKSLRKLFTFVHRLPTKPCPGPTLLYPCVLSQRRCSRNWQVTLVTWGCTSSEHKGRMAKKSSLTLKWLWLTPMTRLLSIYPHWAEACTELIFVPIQSVQIDTRPLPVGLSASRTDTKLTSPFLWPTHIKILAHIKTWVHIRIELTSIWRLWPLTFMWGWWPGWQLPVTVKQLHLSLPNPPDSSSYCFCCCCCCCCCSDSPLTSFPQLPLQSLQLKISCRVTFSLQQISLELAGPLTCLSIKLLRLPSIETLSWLIWPVSTTQTNCQQLLSADCLLTSFYIRLLLADEQQQLSCDLLALPDASHLSPSCHWTPCTATVRPGNIRGVGSLLATLHFFFKVFCTFIPLQS